MGKLKEKRLWLMVGIPGSGKSYWIEKNVSGNDVKVISRDKIRYSLLEDNDEYFSKEKLVWAEFVKEAQSAIEDSSIKDVILDATHLNKVSRHKIISALTIDRDNISVCALVMFTPLDLALERNVSREGRARVPESVIFNMHNFLVMPSKKEEEIDEVFYYIPEEIYDYILPKGAGLDGEKNLDCK